MPELTVSVVVPVRNEADGLDELLDSLEGQTRPPDEVVVVDAGSTDGTLEMLHRRAEHMATLRVLSEPGALPGRGRNVAIAASTGDLVAQIDGGCRVEPDWLEELVAPIRTDEADYTYGRIAPMPVPIRFFGRPFDMGHVIAAVVHPVIRGPGPGAIAGGASVAYRRELWDRAGGFPDWLRCGEDVLFSRNVQDLGARTMYRDESLAWWQVGPRLRDVFARKVRYMVADSLLDRKMREVRKTLGRTVVGLGLLAAMPWWPWAGLLAAAGVGWMWGRKVPRALPIYKARVGRRAEGGWRLFLLCGAVQATMIAAEEVGMLRGLIARLRSPGLAERSDAYRRACREDAD